MGKSTATLGLRLSSAAGEHANSSGFFGDVILGILVGDRHFFCLCFLLVLGDENFERMVHHNETRRPLMELGRH